MITKNKTTSKYNARSPAPHLRHNTDKEPTKKPATTFRLLIAVTGSIIVAEILVMLFLTILPNLSSNLAIFLDAFLLAAVTLPILYLSLFRPLVLHISERQRTEEHLRKTNEFNETLIKTIPFGIDILDEEGRILYLNENLETALGKEAIGKTCSSVYRDTGEACEGCPLQQSVEIGKTRSAVIEGMLDGRTFFISYTGMMYHNEKAILRVFEDITERRQAVEALRESEERCSTVVENSLTGIYIDQDEKIVFANNRFAQIYRYPREELIGIHAWSLVHPEDRTLTNQIRARRLKGEDAPSEYVAKGLTKDGETIWINRRNTRIEYGGKPAILGNIVDITEQKRAEEKLRKINEELKNFVHIASHDLRTPIIGIRGFSSRLVKNYKEKLGEKGLRYLERIEASARRMEILVSDLGALASIGRIVSTFQHVSSLEIVNDVTSEIRDRLKEKRIELIVENNLPTIYCDRERIGQVFQNLVVNAIKYMGDATNPQIEIGYKDRGGFHQFYVRDNGIGIDSKYHRKIFEMFHRLKTIKDKEGTGLGLAIVDRIVSNHGGEVWVESEKGKGATFYFTLSKESGAAQHP